MDIEIIQDFFFWCMLINTGIYVLTVIAVMAFRNIIYKVHLKMFRLDEKTTSESLHRYIANYKLFISVFNFAPWIAIMIIR